MMETFEEKSSKPQKKISRCHHRGSTSSTCEEESLEIMLPAYFIRQPKTIKGLRAFVPLHTCNSIGCECRMQMKSQQLTVSMKIRSQVSKQRNQAQYSSEISNHASGFFKLLNIYKLYRENQNTAFTCTSMLSGQWKNIQIKYLKLSEKNEYCQQI